ncbi:MAG: 30S ribosomal protein S6 [Bacilli bacterium]|nr:30S ribosomal protein S6 [Bacilli bacterium]MDY0064347.1 30S ribosomal protein S6 [Bacilli bacterium]
MKKYKGMYIIRPDLTEEQYKNVVEEMNKIFTDNGSEIVQVDLWGMRELAYEINDFRKGYYVVFITNATVEAVDEYERLSNIREDIIRHIIVKE